MTWHELSPVTGPDGFGGGYFGSVGMNLGGSLVGINFGCIGPAGAAGLTIGGGGLMPAMPAVGPATQLQRHDMTCKTMTCKTITMHRSNPMQSTQHHLKTSLNSLQSTPWSSGRRSARSGPEDENVLEHLCNIFATCLQHLCNIFATFLQQHLLI